MRGLLLCLVLWGVSFQGCAVGRISPLEMRGYAIGGGAKLERCTSYTLGMNRCTLLPPSGKVCTTITGGSLSSGAWDFLGAMMAAVVAYFTAGTL